MRLAEFWADDRRGIGFGLRLAATVAVEWNLSTLAMAGRRESIADWLAKTGLVKPAASELDAAGAGAGLDEYPANLGIGILWMHDAFGVNPAPVR